jgi:hypothetical protein
MMKFSDDQHISYKLTEAAIIDLENALITTAMS